MTWKKGQSGNPKGRPRKGKTMTEELTALLDKTVWPFRKSGRQLIALRLFYLGLIGDIQAIKYICDRLDGKPAQALSLSIDIEERLKRIAENAGLDPDEAVAIAERIIKEKA